MHILIYLIIGYFIHKVTRKMIDKLPGKMDVDLFRVFAVSHPLRLFNIFNRTLYFCGWCFHFTQAESSTDAHCSLWSMESKTPLPFATYQQLFVALNFAPGIFLTSEFKSKCFANRIGNAILPAMLLFIKNDIWLVRHRVTMISPIFFGPAVRATQCAAT